MAKNSKRTGPRIRKADSPQAVQPEVAPEPKAKPDGGPSKAGPFRAVAGFFRLITPKYFVNSWRELRQVTWPNRKETWRLTAAVFVFATIFGGLVAIVDKGIDEIFKKLILR